MYSIILRVGLEVSLGMGADGAELRRGGAHYDMSAVPALPDRDLTLLKDLLGLHIFQQSPVALLVVLLDLGHRPEFGGQLREALQLLEARLGVLFFVVSGFQKQGGDQRKAFFFALEAK
jgi:hypothetical protein